MNYSCQNCGGTAMFDPESGKMKCTQCGGLVTTSLSLKGEDEPESEVQTTGISGRERARLYNENIGKNTGGIWSGFYSEGDAEMDPQSEDSTVGEELPQEAYMEINVYRCTSCGAELMINKRESSTFCAYCGQPTIVFDRVSKELQPNYIIPFKISEEDAVDRIKRTFAKGQFVPKEVKNPDIDKVRGIYIPYWLYTSNIRIQANLTGFKQTQRVGRFTDREYGYTEPVKYYRDAKCTLEKFPLDASKKLNDQLSQRLEPYDMDELRPFDAQYLSGFYADKYDVDVQDVAVIAHNRIREILEEDLKASCYGFGMRIVEKKEEFHVDSIEYALLPAWFLTFRYENEIHTVLVNGQTGKVIGNIPLNKKKVKWWMIGSSLFFSLMFVLIFFIFFAMMDPSSAEFLVEGIPIIILAVVIIVAIFVTGVTRWIAYRKDLERLKSKTTLQYVKKRQDKTWIR